MKSLRPIALLAALATVACGDPLEPVAQGPNVNFAATVYALSGTPPNFPSAFSSTFRQIRRADGQFNWDVAFDIDAEGRVVIYPVRAIGGSYVQTQQVGIQTVAGTFDDVKRAPGGTYQGDTAVVVTPPAGIVIQVVSPLCQFQISSVLYTKLFVQSVDVANRSMQVRALINPNCGFSSLEPGTPGS